MRISCGSGIITYWYHHVEYDDTQSAEITDAAGTSPITGDSPFFLPHHEESAEDAETTASDSTPATDGSSREACHYPLQDGRHPNSCS